VKIPIPAAVLAGGASRRMGAAGSKAALPYGAGTLAEHQTGRLARLFESVRLVAREPPAFPVGPARLLLDTDPERSAMSGLLRALEEAEDRVLVLAVDLPLVPEAVLAELARRSLASDAPALLPDNGGEIEPLAGVWRRSALEEGRRRAAAGDRSLRDFARAVGAVRFPDAEWRALDPSGNAFANVNTIDDWIVARSRA
jgi:molybdopterin-guanine dinucleotide biosynthesis protein A